MSHAAYYPPAHALILRLPVQVTPFTSDLVFENEPSPNAALWDENECTSDAEDLYHLGWALVGHTAGSICAIFEVGSAVSVLKTAPSF